MSHQGRSERFTLSSASGLRIDKRRVAQEVMSRAPLSPALENDSREPVIRSAREFSQGSTLPLGQALRSQNRKWHVIDADGLVVGRAAVVIANVLRGKHKTFFTPHVDCGDGVVVINADKMRFTSDKTKKHVYYKHTGHVVGSKDITNANVLKGGFSERVLEKAVERMIPRSPLGRKQLRYLRIFSGSDYPAIAPDAQVVDVAVVDQKLKYKV